MKYVNKSILKQVYKKRDPWSHKGQFGRLLVIAGSERHTGSPIFVGLSAYRTGCDLVFLVGPKRAMDVAASYSPLLITEPLEGKQLERKHLKILAMIQKVKPKAVVIGPGLWRSSETRKAIIQCVEKTSLPMVIDADAIRAMSVAKEKLKNKKVVLTPHANEFLEFSGVKVTTDIEERARVVKEYAKKYNSVILLKGHVDVISDGKRIVLNKTGDPRMSVGGMGDTLAGILGALLARGCNLFESACAATYINGLAGELAVKRFGESVVTTDLIEEIPRVMKRL